MSYTSLLFILLFFLPPAATVDPAQAPEQEGEFTIETLSESMQVQTKCTKYFGYNTYPGVSDKCVSFNYVSGNNIYFRTVAISTLKAVIDNGKTEPTVEFTGPNQILIRISQQDYDKEKDCLPVPEEKQ